MAFLTGSTHGDAALARRYDVVLSRATLQEMWRPEISTQSQQPRESMGLGFFHYSFTKRTYIGHTGGQAGFLSYLLINPANTAAVIGVVNTDCRTPSCEAAIPGQSAVLPLLH